MHTKKTRDWILLADRAHAKIYTRHYVNGAMQQYIALEHPAARKFQHDQGSDKPGRGHQSSSGAKHSYEDHADFPEQESQAFLQGIADEINEAAAQDEMDRLILVALPKTMAVIKNALSPQAQKKLGGEYAKNLIHLSDSDFQEQLADYESLK